MEKIVYICVETQVRELNGKLLLATELVKRGFKVVLGRHAIIRKMASEGNPGILIDKDFSEIRSEIWSAIKNNGGCVYAIDEEGIVFNSPETYIEARVGQNSLDIASGLLLWGNDQRELITDYLPSVSNKCFVVGNPRNDLLGENANIFYENEFKKHRKAYGDYIMVNTNFARKNVDIVSIVKEHANGISDETAKFIEDRQHFNNLYSDAFVLGIKELAKRYPETNIIIRPHPADVLSRWYEEFQEYRNVHIIRKGDSNEWNIGAKLIIHSGCTTAVEAYECGKVSILYQPIFDERYDLPFPNVLSDKAENIEQLCEMVRKYMESDEHSVSFFSNEKNSIIRDKIHKEQGKYSVELIADILEKNKFTDFKSTTKYAMSFKSRVKDFKLFVKERILKRKNFKFPYMTEKDISKRIDLLKKILKTDIDVNVKKIAINVFILEKGDLDVI